MKPELTLEEFKKLSLGDQWTLITLNRLFLVRFPSSSVFMNDEQLRVETINQFTNDISIFNKTGMGCLGEVWNTMTTPEERSQKTLTQLHELENIITHLKTLLIEDKMMRKKC